MNKKISFLALSIASILSLTACLFTPLEEADINFLPIIDIPEGMKLVETFSDDFNEAEIDETKWTVANNPRRNNYWHPESVSIKDGKLIIETKLARITHTGSEPFTTWHDEKEHLPGAENIECYISGSVNTKQKFTRGFFTAKVKIKQQPGHWNAFWLYCPESADTIDHNGDGEVNGKDGAELDIMECANAGQIYHVIHWNSSDEDLHGKAYATRKLKGYEEGWFLISLLWTEEEYIFYINGQESWRTSAGGASTIPSELIFSDEINNLQSWGGDIRDADELPDNYEIDFVKVYSLEKDQ